MDFPISSRWHLHSTSHDCHDDDGEQGGHADDGVDDVATLKCLAKSI